jgi:hypothetical protein
MRKRFSRSDMFAVNCASWAWRWLSCRDLDADVGTVERRDVLWLWLWEWLVPGVRV